MSRTMRAVVIDAPGGPEALLLRDVPIPEAEAGRVLIRVEAFGLNRSELHFRSGAHRDMESGAHAGKLVVRIER